MSDIALRLIYQHAHYSMQMQNIQANHHNLNINNELVSK